MKFLKLLKKLRALSDHPVHKHSCVIAKGNQVVSIGFNKYKTHTASKHPYRMIHAELAATLDNKFADLNGCTAYIYREDSAGNPAMSRPCASCIQTLQLAGIKKICYSKNGKFEMEKL